MYINCLGYPSIWDLRISKRPPTGGSELMNHPVYVQELPGEREVEVQLAGRQ
jgi:hypothetical protein